MKNEHADKGQVELRKELDKLKRDYQMLTQEMTAGYAFHQMIYDKEGNAIDYIFIDVNAAFEKLTGLRREKIIGKSVREVMPGTEDYWIKKYGDVAKTGKPLQYENYASEIGRYFLVNAFSTRKDHFTVTFIDSTMSHQSESEFIKDYDFFRELVESVKEGVWVTDKNDVVQFVNSGMTVITGGPKSGMLGKCVLKDFDEETIKEFKHFYLKAKKELKPIEYEAKVLTLSKRYTYQSGWLIPIVKKGQFDGMICSVLDTTEQKEFQEIIKKSEEQLRNIIDHSTNIFYSHTSNHEITYFSPQIEKVLGYTPEEVNVKWTSFVSDNPMNEMGWELTNKAIKTGKVQQPYQLELIHKNGSLVRVEVREAPVVKDGKTVAIVGSLTDITERTRIADELKISQEGFRSLIDHSPVAIAILDQFNNIIYLNKEFNHVFGYTPKDIPHIDDWWPLAIPDPNYREIIKKRWAEDLSRGKIRGTSLSPFEATITCKNKEQKFVHAKWTKVGNDLLVILNNLTDQKILQNQLIESNLELKNALNKLQKLNTELNKAKERAEESDRLKSAFLANMSHEIRTPMNSIIGFSSLLSSKNITDEKKDRFSELIQTAGQHLLRIIDDIIDISKIESGQLKIEKVKFNVLRFLEDVFNHHDQSKLRKNNPDLEFNLLLNIEYKNIHMDTDQVRLKQLFDNLLTNAFKNTVDGKVEFGIESVNKKHKKITFFVKDTGVGIPPKYHKEIFSRFMQVENQLPAQGTGLGLSITKGIVDLLGGHIWFKTKVKVGTSFYIELDYDPTIEIEENDTFLKEKKKLNLGGKVIFIAEDDYPSFLYLREILNPTGTKISHFSHGLSLSQAVSESTPDLIIVDINMPVMNGLEAVAEIREKGFKGPIVAQTAYAMPEERNRCIAAGCNDYISKPVNANDLLSMVSKYVPNE